MSQLSRRALLEAGAAGVLAGPFVSRAGRAAAPLRLVTNWYAQAEHAGFYQAQARGFYAAAGLDVRITHGAPQLNTTQLLLAGDCDVIIGFVGAALSGRERGLPLSVIATSFLRPLVGLVVHPDILTIGQLKGHTILLSAAIRATTWPLLRARYGFDDAQVRPYAFSVQPFLLDPTIAIQAYATSEPYALQQKGVPFRFLPFEGSIAADYGNPLVVTADTIAARRDDLGRFLHATMLGWADWMDGDPGPGNAAIRADNPQMTQAQILWARQRLRDLSAFGPPGGFYGRLDPVKSAAIRDGLLRAGLPLGPDRWKAAFDDSFANAMNVVVR